MAHARISLSCLAGISAVLMLSHGVVRAADSDIFQCTDENGKIEYKNTGTTKGCKKLTVEPVIVPATINKPARADSGNFPKVDDKTQKARDSDRKRILEDELKTQEAKLAELKKAYNGGEPDRLGDERNYQKYLDRVQKMKDDIDRAESDVQSVRNELAKM